MPTAEEILTGLSAVANEWRLIAILWHAYFAILVLALIAGLRPSKRLVGVLLALPLLSVGTLAWIHANPFNGLFFTIASMVLVGIACRIKAGNVTISPPWLVVPAALLITFGWVYPHFLTADRPIDYLYAAPTGLIPCPTLSFVIGVTLLLRGLGSRLWCLVLAIAGLLYGVFGAAMLGVLIDWVLFFGAVAMAYVAFSPHVIRPAVRQLSTRE